VAKELILAKGYSNVTVDEICEKCGLSKGAFYIHYKSKEDIVRKLYRDDITDYMDERFRAYLQENKDASPVDKLKAFIRLTLRFPSTVGEELTKLAFVVGLSAKSADGTSWLSDCIEPMALGEIVDEGISLSLFRNDLTRDEIVNCVNSHLAGALITWCLANFSYDLIQTGEVTLDVLVKGLQ
jgi:TetR/AcrR family transcriptional regulator, fatty acid metabolism regulator protein